MNNNFKEEKIKELLNIEADIAEKISVEVGSQ
jgi:hypothetical protein